MYDFARGPLMWVAAIVFAAGVFYRMVQLFVLTRKKEPLLYAGGGTERAVGRSAEERKLERLAAFQNSLLGRHPVVAIVSTVFHTCLFMAPVFLVAHNLLLYESWGFSFMSLPDAVCDVMTVILLAGGLFFLLRRLVVPQVAAVSSPYDYILLLVTTAPFLTGFFAYHQLFDYRTVLILHMLSGELMLVAVPFTKLGHMVFFFFVRLLVGGEYSLGRGNRTWSA